MKSWTWQMWVGKLLLFALALVGLIGKELGLEIPWAAIIVPAATGFAQVILGFVPGEGWARVVGKVLVWAESTVALVLAQLGLQIPIWTVIAPMILALAQYFIGLAPPQHDTPA